MLNAKIREEADELCRAETREEIASEAADLLYFALVRCLANGVSLSDVSAVLDKRAGKVTRRPGNAKAPFVKEEEQAAPAPAKTNGQNGASDRQEAMVNGTQATTKPLPAAQVLKPEPTLVNGAAPSEEKIVPLKFSLKGTDKKGRDALLQRPLASSQDMIGRVQPIISAVRTEGDAALRGYIKNFDRCAQVDDASWKHVLTAPFDPALMAIDDETARNIDTAFDNIRQFHQAQVSSIRLLSVLHRQLISPAARTADGQRDQADGGRDNAGSRMHTLHPAHRPRRSVRARWHGCSSFDSHDARCPSADCGVQVHQHRHAGRA